MSKLSKIIITVTGALILSIILLAARTILEKEAENIRQSRLLKIPGLEKFIGIKIENQNYISIPSTIRPKQQEFSMKPQADYQEILNSTATWQTYKNDYFGFIFQYPAEITLTPTPEPELESKNRLIISGGFLFELRVEKVINGNEQNELHYEKDSHLDTGLENKNCAEPFFGRTDIPAIHTKFGDGFDLMLIYTIFTKKSTLSISWWDENSVRPTWNYDSVENSSIAISNEASIKKIAEEIAIQKLRIKILKTLVFDNPEDQPMKGICQISP
ncbi:MAG: hypothetical protein AAB903_00430 [Patescibacteria group bacterium]